MEMTPIIMITIRKVRMISTSLPSIERFLMTIFQPKTSCIICFWKPKIKTQCTGNDPMLNDQHLEGQEHHDVLQV